MTFALMLYRCNVLYTLVRARFVWHSSNYIPWYGILRVAIMPPYQYTNYPIIHNYNMTLNLEQITALCQNNSLILWRVIFFIIIYRK